MIAIRWTKLYWTRSLCPKTRYPKSPKTVVEMCNHENCQDQLLNFCAKCVNQLHDFWVFSTIRRLLPSFLHVNCWRSLCIRYFQESHVLLRPEISTSKSDPANKLWWRLQCRKGLTHISPGTSSPSHIAALQENASVRHWKNILNTNHEKIAKVFISTKPWKKKKVIKKKHKPSTWFPILFPQLNWTLQAWWVSKHVVAPCCQSTVYKCVYANMKKTYLPYGTRTLWHYELMILWYYETLILW